MMSACMLTFAWTSFLQAQASRHPRPPRPPRPPSRLQRLWSMQAPLLPPLPGPQVALCRRLALAQPQTPRWAWYAFIAHCSARIISSQSLISFTACSRPAAC